MEHLFVLKTLSHTQQATEVKQFVGVQCEGTGHSLSIGFSRFKKVNNRQKAIYLKYESM